MVVVLAGIVVVVIGLPLCIFGLRGARLGLAAHCARCSFDLSGSMAASSQCPECGRTLTDHRAIRVGVLRRRPGRALCGAVLLALGISLIVAPGVSRRLGIDWNRHKPVWLLLHEATRPILTPRSPRALGELERRCQQSTLTVPEARAIASAMLDAHADRSLRWDPRCADLMLAALPYHDRPREIVERYIHQLATFEVRTDPTYPQERAIPIDLWRPPPRLGTSDTWWITAELESVTINGVPVDIDPDDPRPFNTTSGRWFQPWNSDLAMRYPFSFWGEAPLGDMPVEATWRIRAMTGKASGDWARNVHRATVNGAKPEEFKDEWDAYGELEWTHAWSGVMRFTPPEPHRFVITDDSTPLDVIERCVTDVNVNAGKTPDGVALWISGAFRSPPVDLAYEVRLVTPHGTKLIGVVGGLADETAGFFFQSGIETLDDRQVTLRFIPRADYAGRRQGMMTIDGHHLERSGLYVDWVIP